MTNLSGANLNNGFAVGSKSEGRDSPSNALVAIPKYEAYKESGVDWLGGMPSEWDLIANKHIFKLKKRLVGKRSSLYDLLSLTLRGIIKRDMENPEGKFPAEFDTYQEVASGDFVFCLFDVEETPRTVGLSSFDGMITGAYTVFECLPEFDKRFLYYFYLNLDSSKRMKPLYKGLRNTIPKDAFLSFKTFVPKKSIQTAIANFLDQKTAQIDEAIAIKETQIALLKERKQIIIQKAVTQGLNPDVPMKDSGVEWIGKIPEHWEVKKIKYLAKIFRGKFTHRPRNDPSLYDGIYPFFQTGDVARASKFLKNYRQTLNEKGLRVSTLIPKGTVVITIAANIGDVAILDLDACFPDSVVGFSPREKIGRDFLYFALGNMKQQFMDSSIKNTQMNLNVERIGSNYICQPPTEEQKCIVEYIEKIEVDTELAIDLQLTQIEKLREYKATLINSAVTGKIKVA